MRVEGLYEDQMSEVDQQAAHTQQQSDADAAHSEAEAQAIPSMLLALFEAPYVFGPTMVRVADNGLDTGANGLFRHPPANDAAFFDPSTLVEHAEFVKVPVPKLDKGDKKVGQPDGFGPYALYLLLGSRVDLYQSLQAADEWAGDSMVSFERHGKPCLRATFVGRGKDGNYDIGVALDTWVYGRSPDSAEVHWEDDWVTNGVTLTACDTGAPAPDAVRGGDTILAFAAYRGLLRRHVHAGCPGEGRALRVQPHGADQGVRALPGVGRRGTR